MRTNYLIFPKAGTHCFLEKQSWSKSLQNRLEIKRFFYDSSGMEHEINKTGLISENYRCSIRNTGCISPGSIRKLLMITLNAFAKISELKILQIKSVYNLNYYENISWLLVLHFFFTAGSLDLFVNGNVEATKAMSYVKHVSYVIISICC